MGGLPTETQSGGRPVVSSLYRTGRKSCTGQKTPPGLCPVTTWSPCSPRVPSRGLCDRQIRRRTFFTTESTKDFGLFHNLSFSPCHTSSVHVSIPSLVPFNILMDTQADNTHVRDEYTCTHPHLCSHTDTLTKRLHRVRHLPPSTHWSQL